jgi:YidC/Oxa1 family membrane protein insertase
MYELKKQLIHWLMRKSNKDGKAEKVLTVPMVYKTADGVEIIKRLPLNKVIIQLL